MSEREKPSLEWVKAHQDELAERFENFDPRESMASGVTSFTTPTLTEFLLARIAEDEAEVQDWPTDGSWGKFDDDLMWTDPNGRPIYAPRARVLAECNAKREITKRSVILEAASESEPESVELAWHAQGALEAALVIAAIYAEHPDYQEEWRP